MIQSEVKKKSAALLIVVCILALCIGLGAALSFGQKQNGRDAADATPMEPTVQKQFTFGETYTIDGKQYTLGEKEDECMDYYAALGLSRTENIVSLTKFTYLDGSDWTEETTAVRHAGTYEFEIQPLAAGAQAYSDTVLVDGYKIIVDVNAFNVFVNASSPAWSAHGDITTIYQHNNGWYFVQVGDNAVVNTRTVTNATYTIHENQNDTDEAVKYIMIRGEKFLDNATYKTVTRTQYRYGGTDNPNIDSSNGDNSKNNNVDNGTGGVVLDITSREGVTFNKNGEYVAAFSFQAPTDYWFDYSDESKLSEKYKGLDVPEKERTKTTFVLKKYWYIVYSNDSIGMNGYLNGGEPYSPFAISNTYMTDNPEGQYTGETDKVLSEKIAVKGTILDYDLDDFMTPNEEKEFAVVDTVTYGDDIVINEPNIVDPTKTNTTGASAEFAIEYEPLDGSGKVPIRELGAFEHAYWWEELGSEVYNQKMKAKKNKNEKLWNKTNYSYSNEQNTIQYYLNKYMPAGTYTLTLVYYPDSSKSKKTTGEYKLYVLPKAFDEGLLTDLQNRIRGDEEKSADGQGTGSYSNIYALDAKQMHKDTTTEINAINADLLYKTKSDRQLFWATITDEQEKLFYDTEVTIMYNRQGFGGSTYFDKDGMLDTFTQIGDYIMYYSVSAKNYATTGAADSADREQRKFNLTLTTGISIQSIYDMITDGNTYFQDVAYIGNINGRDTNAYTTIYTSAYYSPSWTEADYVNTGRVSVSLTINNDYRRSASWFNDLKTEEDGEDTTASEFAKYFALAEDDPYTLKVFYNIIPADNGWSIAPQISTWEYDSFNKDNNNITGTLRFSVESKSDVIFRIGREKSGGGYEWLKITKNDGSASYSFDNEGSTFNVDDDGKVIDADVVAALKQFEVGTYYLESTVPALANPKAVEGEQDENKKYNVKAFTTPEGSYSVVNVRQTQNRWDTIPYVIGWSYNGFDVSNFNAGVPYYNVTSGEVVNYALYEGADTSIAAKKKFDFTNISDKVNDFTALSAGQYTIVASYKGTDNYADLSLSIFFNVSPAQNSWSPAPYIIGWTYGNYNASNFQEGTPALNTESKQVEYTLYKEGSNTSTKLWDDPKTDKNEINGVFATLGAGSYKMVASFAAAANHAALSQDIFFSVAQAQNSWRQAPRMLGWTYPGFTAGSGGNFQEGIPTHTTAEVKVIYALYEGTDTSESGTKKFEFTDINDVKDEDTKTTYVDEFVSLGAGTYTLVASYAGTTDYSDLSLSMVFSVAKAQNIWTTTPSIVGWTIGGFNTGLFTPGAAAYNTEGITYALYSGTEISEDSEPVFTFTDIVGNITNTDASITDDENKKVENQFKLLIPGNYTLVASIIGTGDYSDLSMPMTFSVSQAQNSWERAPFITGWAYKSFAAGTNFQSGTPSNPISGESVTYTVYSGNTATGNGMFTFTDINGKVDGTDVTDKLNALEVGTYTLRAYLKGDNNYVELTLSIVFSVSKAQNSWKTAPFITGWAYDDFVASTNFRAGEDGRDVPKDVVYTLYNGNTIGTDNKYWEQTFTALNDKITGDFKALPYGTYTLHAYLAGDGNYEALEQSIVFNVTQAQNSWTKTPSIVGWTVGGYSADLFTAGTARFNTAGIVYSVYEGSAVSGSAKFSFTDIANAKTDFEKLIPGNYTLNAEIAQDKDNNYSALSMPMVFTVSMAQNGWSITPTVIGWTFGSYNARLFTPGEASYTPADKKVQYTLSKESDDKSETQWGPIDVDNVSANLGTLGAGQYKLEVKLEGDAYYSALSLDILFSVAQAQNTWDTTPTVIGWTFGSYDSKLFTPGEAVFPETKNSNTDKVQYTLYKEGDTSVKQWNDPIDNVDTINEKFGALGAGQYKLVATFAGTSDYTALSLDIMFSVAQAQNIWTTTPSIVGWVFGSDPSSLFTAGVAQYGTVGYTLTGGSIPSGGQTITVDSDGSTGFKLSSASVEYLKALNPGTYTLTATVAEDADYYSALSMPMTFSVSQAQNSWKSGSAPFITGWAYKSFNASSNFQSGEAQNNPENKKITYAVYSGNTATGSSLFEFTDINGTIDSTKVTDKFNNLPAKQYTLVAELEGTTDYADLTQSIVFSVSKAENSWYTTPVMVGFAYGGFTDTNFRAGVANLDEDKENKKITYTLTKGIEMADESTAAEPWSLSLEVTEFGRFTDATKKALNELAVDGYTLEVKLLGTDNYNDLVGHITFNITQASNGWEESGIPAISSWTYGDPYNRSADSVQVTAGSAYFGDVKYTVQSVDINGGISDNVSDFEELDFDGLIGKLLGGTPGALTGLNAGSYNLHVEVKETTDYAAVSRDIRFTVSKANNSWVEDKKPSISGWTFGNEPNAHNTPEAAVDTGHEIQYKYYAAKNDGSSSVDYDSPVLDLSAAFAGYYAMVVTLEGNENYNDLVEIVYFTIGKQEIKWDETTALQRVEWYLSEIDNLPNNPLTKVAVKTESGQSIVSYTLSYAISRAVGSSYNIITTVTVSVNGDIRDLDALINALKELEAGNYSIVITAVLGEAGNYDLQSMTVAVEVKLSEPSITDDPSSGGSGGNGIYNWNWGESDDKKTLSDMVVSQDGAVVTYRIGSGSTWSNEYNDFATMLRDLRAKDVGNYTVEYIVRCENYATITRQATVIINEATNEWEKQFTDSDDGIAWTWNNVDSSKLQMPEAKYGNESVVYTVLKDGSPFTTFRASDYMEGDDEKTSYQRLFDAFADAIKNWNAGTYRVTVSVDKTVNYSAASFTFNITINQVQTEWSSTPGANGSSTSRTYGDTYNDLKEPTVSASWGKDALYTLKFSTANDNDALYSGSSWSALIARLRECEAEDDDYTISAHIDGDDNHTALDFYIIVRISVQANSWENQTGEKQVDWTYGSATAPNIVFEPKYNSDKMVVRVNNITVPYANLAEYLKGLNAADYTITATVAADKKYGALSDTVTLSIKRANNSWTNDLSIAASWDWSDLASEIDTMLVLPISAQGDSAQVTVAVRNGATRFSLPISYVSEDGVRTINANDKAAIINALCALDVASAGYTITVTVGALDNYNALEGGSAKSASFTVNKATNSWVVAPEFRGGNVKNTGDKSYEWVFESEVTVVYEPRFVGSSGVLVEYYNIENNGSVKVNSMPVNVGIYKAVFSVEEGSNYKAMAEAYELTFVITGKTSMEFTVSPGVTAWSWSNYDKYVNLFTGIPVSLGAVTFMITSIEDDKDIIIDKFQLVNEEGRHTGSFNDDKYAPDNIVAALNNLTKGTYKLWLIVAPNGNYDGFEVSTTFNVSEAENRWTETPRVNAWYEGNYNEDVNTPTAKSLYGTPVIVVKAKGAEIVYYNSASGENWLDTAPVGEYIVTITVNGVPGQYNGLEEFIEFQIFVNSDLNYWVEVPGMDGWTANIEGEVNLPTGTPQRGKPYFEFYTAEYVKGEWIRGGIIVAGEDSKLISEERFARDFYIPIAPGTYFMIAYAENPDDPDDDLGVNHSSRIMFTIRDREIEWDQTVRISSVLYLGQKDKWSQPTSRTSLTGDKTEEITYRYLDALTRKDLGSQIPTEVGKYIVVAYAKARYTQTISCEMMFDVELSKNSWKDGILPSIDGWSEEFNSGNHNPFGEAMYGAISYMYIDKDHPDIILTEKPTKAGHYIMIARVELEGYETLEARYEFTIDPAYDDTFVMIDIILGLVACAFAVVVIVFAIRRYKEN